MPWTRITEIIEELREIGEPVCFEAALVLEAGIPAEANARLRVDLDMNEAERADRRTRLSPNEAVLLHVLHQRLGRATPIDVLHAQLYGAHVPIVRQNVRAAIPSLRRKVKSLGGDIITHFRDGYKLELHPMFKKSEINVRPAAAQQEATS